MQDAVRETDTSEDTFQRTSTGPPALQAALFGRTQRLCVGLALPPPDGTHPCTAQQDAPSHQAYTVNVLATYPLATIVATSALPAAADLGAMVCIGKHFNLARVWPNNSCPCNHANPSWPLEMAKAEGTYECGATGRITAL